MKRSSLSLPEVLDDAFAVAVHVASPWMGVLWLTALPVRLLQIHFAARVFELGAEASQYGAHLLDLASLAGLAFLLSLWGRAVFVRAAGLALRSLESPGPEALRLAPAAGLSYVYAALVLEVLFFALGWTLLGLPLFILLAGLAAATFPLNDRPSLLRPLREIARHTTPLLVLLGLLLVFGVALLIAALNLYFHDVRFLVGVALTLWFYMTPVIYPVSYVPDKYKIVFDLNPNSLFINAYRRVLLQGENPGLDRVLLGLAIAGVTFFVGYYLFKKMEPTFADRI